ncbi:MAG: carboxypeptidase regulatory-like domain-containing protein [Chitinophagaceae bacterium]|nr:carboxypeptidase regulatory-like domain-containing protein [Chitinophagaceae bacterium]
MTKNQKARIDMYDAILLLFRNNETIVFTLLALKTAISNFHLRVSNIRAAEEFTQKKLTGITTGKQALKELLASQFAINAAQLSACAFQQGDYELQKDADITIKGLQRKGQNDIVPLCHHLLGLLVANITKLTDYGIDGNTLDNLKVLLAEYETEKPAYVNARSARSARVKKRKEEFTAASALLKHSIDKLMLKLKADYPEFYDTYRISRQLNNRGSRSTRISGTITAPDNKGVHKAQVLATAVNSEVKYKTFTGINGDFVLRIPKAGTYKITVTHTEWSSPKEQVIEVVVGNQYKLEAQFSMQA